MPPVYGAVISVKHEADSLIGAEREHRNLFEQEVNAFRLRHVRDPVPCIPIEPMPGEKVDDRVLVVRAFHDETEGAFRRRRHQRTSRWCFAATASSSDV